MQIYKVLQFPSTNFIILKSLHDDLIIKMLQVIYIANFLLNKIFLPLFIFICKDLIYY